MRFGTSVPKQKENFRQKGTGIRKIRGNFKIQIISKQFSDRHTSIHSSTHNPDYNTGDNIYHVWTIKIKSFSNKHSDAMYRSSRSNRHE